MSRRLSGLARERQLASDGAEAERAVERTFRERHRQVIGILLRRFGPGRLDAIEDGVQSAFMKAVALWPERGAPDHPTAWLATVASHHVVDGLRRESRAEAKGRETERALYGRTAVEPEELDPLADDALELVLLSCSPVLSRQECLSLTLRLACGLGAREIAAALLKREDAVRKTITRAKEKLRRAAPAPAPARWDGAELDARLDRVLDIVYLLFNEGYAARSGENWIRRELCVEAGRLGDLLVETPLPRKGAVQALRALMAFQAARLPARSDGGRLVRLQDQDRSRWDRALLGKGMRALELSMEAPARTRYHLEAAIAACHAAASSYDATDWERILLLYDDLAAISPSPIVALNRSVALTMVRGPEAGLAAVMELEASGALPDNHLVPALIADNLRRLGRGGEAVRHYRRALDLVMSAPERQFLTDQLSSCFTGFASGDS